MHGSSGCGARAGARYLGPGSCAGGVQPVVKPVVAAAAYVVEFEPERAVNGQRLLGNSSAAPIVSAGRSDTRSGGCSWSERTNSGA